MLNIGVVVGLIKSLAPGVNQEVIEEAVSDWLDAHPEATTTVEDGSITEQKLATELATKLSNMDGDVTQLKSAIDEKAYVIYTDKSGTIISIKDGTATKPDNLRVFGHTVQDVTPGYDIYPLSKCSLWDKGGKPISYTVNSDDSITITSTSDYQGNNQVTAYAAKDIDFSIYSGKKFRFRYDSITLTDSSRKFSLLMTAYGDTNVEIGISNKTSGTTNQVSNEYTLPNNLNVIRISFRMIGSSSNPVLEGETATVTGLRLYLSDANHEYTVQSVIDPVITVNEDDVEIETTLRSVPSDDGTVKYNGVLHLADEINFATGKIIRRIDSDIDLCESAAISDYSDYILETPVEENIPASAIAAYEDVLLDKGENTVTADYDKGDALIPFDTPPFIEIDYKADTKLYIDESSGNGFVSPSDFGAVGDGVTDDTDAIVMALNSGKDVLLEKDAIYLVNKFTTNLLGNVVVDGNGATIRQNVSGLDTSKIIHFIECDGSDFSWIKIKNLTIDHNARNVTIGSSVSSDTVGGFILQNFANVTLENVTCMDTLTGFACKIDGAVNVVIDGCTMADTGKPEVSLVTGMNYNWGGIDIKANTSEYNDTTCIIRNSMFTNCSACGISGPFFFKNVEIYNNTFIDMRTYSIEDPLNANFTYDEMVKRIHDNQFIRCNNAVYSSSTTNTPSGTTLCTSSLIEIYNNTISEFLGAVNRRANDTINENYIAIVVNNGNDPDDCDLRIVVRDNVMKKAAVIADSRYDNCNVSFVHIARLTETYICNNFVVGDEERSSIYAKHNIISNNNIFGIMFVNDTEINNNIFTNGSDSSPALNIASSVSYADGLNIIACGNSAKLLFKGTTYTAEQGISGIIANNYGSVIENQNLDIEYGTNYDRPW